MRRIITIVTVIICLFIGQSSVMAQKQDVASEYIKIKPLQPTYKDKDSIQLRLTSKIDSIEILFVIVSLEEKLESGWVQVIEDVFAKKNDDKKVKNSKLVLRQEDTILNIPVAKLKDNILDLLSDASYRFSLEVRTTPLRKVEVAYTTPFDLQ